MNSQSGKTSSTYVYSTFTTLEAAVIKRNLRQRFASVMVVGKRRREHASGRISATFPTQQEQRPLDPAEEPKPTQSRVTVATFPISPTA